MSYSKQITYNTFGTVVTLFCQWLIIMFIPKITDFAEAGIFAVAISVCSILNHIATFSLKEFQISDQNTRYTDADYKSVRLITIALSFIGIIPFIFVFGNVEKGIQLAKFRKTTDYVINQSVVFSFKLINNRLLVAVKPK